MNVVNAFLNLIWRWFPLFNLVSALHSWIFFWS